MSEITNPYEQVELAAEAAGYLGALDEGSGERQWLADHCTGDEFDPRESFEDAVRLICTLGLLVEVDRGAGVVTVVIGADHVVDHCTMTERFDPDGRFDMDAPASPEYALKLAVTRAAAEIGKCKVMGTAA
ncbi:hypothetical protein [Chromobacterium subtsugae]|uniref:hypothetical protein n=1 Tax=Chromobacterium subtsugae TaxID=251747 RepID=UPI0007F9237B|nr:hypothetical protein [Chromobacterium subtsugae]OBU86699.1 hypothetical protein MY55_07625 [Chromobacterium subtsugae]